MRIALRIALRIVLRVARADSVRTRPGWARQMALRSGGVGIGWDEVQRVPGDTGSCDGAGLFFFDRSGVFLLELRDREVGLRVLDTHFLQLRHQQLEIAAEPGDTVSEAGL